MTAYNAYIEKQPKGRDAFSAELQGLEFFSEVSETIAEAGSNFANEVKKEVTRKKLATLKRS